LLGFATTIIMINMINNINTNYRLISYNGVTYLKLSKCIYQIKKNSNSSVFNFVFYNVVNSVNFYFLLMNYFKNFYVYNKDFLYYNYYYMILNSVYIKITTTMLIINEYINI